MGLVLTLVAADEAQAPAAETFALEALTAAGARVKTRRPLGPGAVDLILVEGTDPAAGARAAARLGDVLKETRTDYALQPQEGRRKSLLVADMDSTMITCECLDELAAFAGVKEEVAAITVRAMEGELDFEGALKARVALLKGLPLTALSDCYEQRVRPTPGAETLVRTMAAHGARCVLVSGGFRYFTGRVAAALGFAADHANVLKDDGTHLTGEVGEPVLGRAAKLQILRSEAGRAGVAPADVLAVGDGANDLDMIRAAGLGAAFRAKPLVAAAADARVDHADLTALLYFQGYAARSFVGGAGGPPA